MHRLLMLEEQKARKREDGFDYIETAAEIDARCWRSNIISEIFFYRNMFNPRRPHTPDKSTLEMRVDVERLRIEIILSQPAVDTGPQEMGKLRRSPATGTGSDEPGVSRVETSTDTEEIFPLETSMDGFLHSNCTSPEQECTLL